MKTQSHMINAQYQYSIDKDSRIINNPNKFKPEGGKYAFDLILSLITV